MSTGAKTRAERLSDAAVIANVWKLAPSWGGTLSAAGGHATFRRTAGTGRVQAMISRYVEYDPDTGVQRGEPVDVVDMSGDDGSNAWVDLGELPALLRALGELAGAAGMVARWEDGQQYR